MRKLRLTLAVAALAAALPAVAQIDSEITGSLAVQYRYFPESPADPRQHGNNASMSFEPELFLGFNRDWSLTASGFMRVDEGDEERSHVDIRQLYMQYVHGDIEVKAGVAKVFWGVAEAQHLVDVINQTDLVENPDGEDKLGQPMLNLTWATQHGLLDFFLLNYFRERTFPGTEGRLRPPLPVAQDDALYENEAEQRHISLALRYAHSLAGWDIGLSHFSGTAREPRLLIENRPTGPVLRPFYEQMQQTGVDVQSVIGGWLLKFEGIRRLTNNERYFATTTGFEFTLVGLLGSAADFGIVGEYLFDERGKDGPSPFDNDVFLAGRLAMNDAPGSELLAGAIVDLDSQATFFSVEASRRFGDSWKTALEARWFAGVPDSDPLFAFRRDDYVQLELIRYF